MQVQSKVEPNLQKENIPYGYQNYQLISLKKISKKHFPPDLNH